MNKVHPKTKTWFLGKDNIKLMCLITSITLHFTLKPPIPLSKTSLLNTFIFKTYSATIAQILPLNFIFMFLIISFPDSNTFYSYLVIYYSLKLSFELINLLYFVHRGIEDTQVIKGLSTKREWKTQRINSNFGCLLIFYLLNRFRSNIH